jgi:hypothetical protein
MGGQDEYVHVHAHRHVIFIGVFGVQLAIQDLCSMKKDTTG